MATASQADVVISGSSTQNMSCANGVCAPTASDAVLNVTDLENLLASGSVEVTTTGSGVQANNIDITGAFGWSSTSTLSLDAWQSIAFTSAVSVTGEGGLLLTTNDGGSNGTLTFGLTGSASFQNLSSALAINRVSYTLVNSISGLANAVADHPAGNIALAASYDASQDGTYTDSPVTEELTGTVQGLGNTIANLSINHPHENKGASPYVGLFMEIGNSALVASVRMSGFDIRAHPNARSVAAVGGLVALSQGILFDDHVAGRLLMHHHTGVGGLAAIQSGGTILWCSADVKISTSGLAGGLVYHLTGNIEQSYAMGTVNGGDGAGVGGLVGYMRGEVYESYSTASVRGGDKSLVGGLLEEDDRADIFDTYASGPVSGGRSSHVGGLVGSYASGTTTNNYWDKTTSGTKHGIGGGGGNTSGITGLTTRQFRAGLPSGFDPSVWAEQEGVNDGLPYLIGNPPPY